MSRSQSSGPLVSVIIPVYNAADTLHETLRAACAQTYSPIEIVVVNDGSTDGSDRIVAELAGRDARLIVVRQSNAGVSGARNHGLAIARGELIAPLDADNLWHPEKLAIQVACMQTWGSECGMVYCWSTNIDESGHIIHHPLAVERFEGDIYGPLVLANFIGNGSVPLIRRRLLEEVGAWDPKLREGCEDWQVYLRIAERADVALTPFYLVGYRQRSNAMSRNILAMRRSYRLVMAEVRRSHPELGRDLFRWSEAAFNIYTAELLIGAGERLWGLRLGLLGILQDPTWLLRRSSRRKLRGVIHRMRHLLASLFLRKRARPSILSTPSYPIGLHFSDAPIEPHRIESEGAKARQRDSIGAAIRIRRTGG